MGKGGCVPATAVGGFPSEKESKSNDVGEISTLEKERLQKIEDMPKFYWADDEEPHRRR